MDLVQGLYDEKESSMDELGGFEPTDTTGFIQIESIRIKKYVKKACRELILTLWFGDRWAQANIGRGQSGVEPRDVYGTRV
jgi:argininosuccinate synthase